MNFAARMASTVGARIPHVPSTPSDVDPFFDDVLLLMHGEGTSGSQVFVDSSKYARVFTPTGTLVPKIDTGASKFGLASLANDGSVKAQETPPINLHGLSYTAEFWFRTTEASLSMRLFDTGTGFRSLPDVPGFGARIAGSPSRLIQWLIDGTDAMGASAAGTFDGNWHWVVVCADTIGNAFLAIDGIKEAISFAGVNPLNPITGPCIDAFSVFCGRNAPGAVLMEPFNGNMDELRITARIRYEMGGRTGDTIPIQTQPWPDR